MIELNPREVNAMGDERFTRFDYLLNAMQAAGDQPRPADHGYGEKRRKLYEYVRELERKAAAYDALAASPVAADTRKLMQMTEAEIDAELLGMGIDPATAAQKGAQAVADARARCGGYVCGICGRSTPHPHTPEEIVIFRNGIKRGAAITEGKPDA